MKITNKKYWQTLMLLLNPFLLGVESNNTSSSINISSELKESTNRELSQEETKYLDECFFNEDKRVEIPLFQANRQEQLAINENEYSNVCNYKANGNTYGSYIGKELQSISSYISQKINHAHEIVNPLSAMEKLMNELKRNHLFLNIASIMDMLWQDYNAEISKKDNESSEQLFRLKVLMNGIYTRQALKIFMEQGDNNTIKIKGGSFVEKLKSEKINEDSSDDEEFPDLNNNTKEQKYEKFQQGLLNGTIILLRSYETIFLEYLNIKLSDKSLSAKLQQDINYFVTGLDYSSESSKKILDYLDQGQKLKQKMNQQIEEKLDPSHFYTIMNKDIDNELRQKAIALLKWGKPYEIINSQIDGYNGGICYIEGIFFLINWKMNEDKSNFILQKEIFRDNLTCSNLTGLTDIYCQLQTNNTIKPKQILKSMNYNQMTQFVEDLIDKFQKNSYILKKSNQEETVRTLKKFSVDIKNAIDIKDETIQKKTIKQIKRNMIAYLDSLVYVNKTTNYTYNGVNSGWNSHNLLPILGETFDSVNRIEYDFSSIHTKKQGIDKLKTQNRIDGHIFASLRLEDKSINEITSSKYNILFTILEHINTKHLLQYSNLEKDFPILIEAYRNIIGLISDKYMTTITNKVVDIANKDWESSQELKKYKLADILAVLNEAGIIIKEQNNVVLSNELKFFEEKKYDTLNYDKLLLEAVDLKTCFKGFLTKDEEDELNNTIDTLYSDLLNDLQKNSQPYLNPSKYSDLIASKELIEKIEDLYYKHMQIKGLIIQVDALEKNKKIDKIKQQEYMKYILKLFNSETYSYYSSILTSTLMIEEDKSEKNNYNQILLDSSEFNRTIQYFIPQNNHLFHPIIDIYFGLFSALEMIKEPYAPYKDEDDLKVYLGSKTNEEQKVIEKYNEDINNITQFINTLNVLSVWLNELEEKTKKKEKKQEYINQIYEVIKDLNLENLATKIEILNPIIINVNNETR